MTLQLTNICARQVNTAWTEELGYIHLGQPIFYKEPSGKWVYLLVREIGFDQEACTACLKIKVEIVKKIIHKQGWFKDNTIEWEPTSKFRELWCFGTFDIQPK